MLLSLTELKKRRKSQNPHPLQNQNPKGAAPDWVSALNVYAAR